MDKKIYVITYGEYSDYRIHSLWSDKEVAEKNCKLLGWYHQVEEWDVDINKADHTWGDIFGVEVSYDFSQPGTEILLENLIVKDAIVSKTEQDKVILMTTHASVKSANVEDALRALIQEFS